MKFNDDKETIIPNEMLKNLYFTKLKQKQKQERFKSESNIIVWNKNQIFHRLEYTDAENFMNSDYDRIQKIVDKGV